MQFCFLGYLFISLKHFCVGAWQRHPPLQAAAVVGRALATVSPTMDPVSVAWCWFMFICSFIHGVDLCSFVYLVHGVEVFRFF